MSSFSGQQHPFVLNSFLEPGNLNSNMFSQFEEGSFPSTQTCFSSSFLSPDGYLQGFYAPALDQIHEARQFMIRRTAEIHADRVKQDSSSSFNRAVEFESGDGTQESSQVVSPVASKRKISSDTKMVRKNKRGKQGNQSVKLEAKDQEKIVPTGFVHVRARRGEATDKHSLAERVRREKISVRMKLLQSLVPGCDKLTGKALILDEIIKYVRSLQNRVEFLETRISCVDLDLTFRNLEANLGSNLISSEIAMPGETNLAIAPGRSTPMPFCDQEQIFSFTSQDNGFLLGRHIQPQ